MGRQRQHHPDLAGAPGHPRDPARPADFVLLGSYDDELVRTTDGWRIRRRVVGALGPGGLALRLVQIGQPQQNGPRSQERLVSMNDGRPAGEIAPGACVDARFVLNSLFSNGIFSAFCHREAKVLPDRRSKSPLPSGSQALLNRLNAVGFHDYCSITNIAKEPAIEACNACCPIDRKRERKDCV